MANFNYGNMHIYRAINTIRKYTIHILTKNNARKYNTKHK